MVIVVKPLKACYVIYTQGENGTFMSWKSTYLNVSLLVSILTSFTKAFQLSPLSFESSEKLVKILYTVPNVYQLA